MPKPITPDVVVAYGHCPRKAFFLLCTDEQGSPHDYATMLARQRAVNRANVIARLKQQYPEVMPSGKLLDTGRVVLLEATLRVQDLEATCDVLRPVARGASARGHRYEPTIVVGTRTVGQEQQFELLFVGQVLGQLQRALPPAGTIIGRDDKVHRVPLVKHYARLTPILETLRAWTQAPSADPPPVILNKHCPECQFRAGCLAQAERDDDLSLLERLTPKARKRYHDRGIFTVRQLSYVYRPRRRGKRAPKAPVQHHPELQALALRTRKTYLHELPTLIRNEVDLFLDIEGIPGQRWYYLFGLLVCQEGTAAYRSFWADAVEQEEQTWRQLLATLDEFPDAPVYHYGRYEQQAIATLARRHHTDCGRLDQRLINLNASVYGKVYFPVRSNRLKDIGRFLGASWSEPEASGLLSLVWRQCWEETVRPEDKQRLLMYNEEDCRALLALADELTRLRDAAAVEPSVDFATRPKRYATDTGEEIHSQFGAILRSAHAGYEHTKISLGRTRQAPIEHERHGARLGHRGFGRRVPKAGKVVHVPPRETCSVCNNNPLKPTTKLAEKTTVDLVFTNSGCRKITTKYVGPWGDCSKCGKHYLPSEIRALGKGVFGHGLQAWVIYQRLVLRLPYRSIAQVLEEQFRERISEGSFINFLRYFADYYAETEDRCRQRLLTSPFIHVDETKINIQGTDHYVWVFTDGKHVLFRLTATREATIVQEVLAGYDGILIADFYGGYDAINCRQQRCLVHLIRDLNEDLWRAPFDTEFEAFVLAVRDLLVPILEAAHRYGLRRRHLGKFRKRVDRFYHQVIIGRSYRSDLTRTYQKRFQRYRSSMFTFLEYDGIPWNNNMAERAIRHLAIQRKISGSFFASVAPQYLLLLGLAQTCRFQDKSLLKFLLSGEKDIDQFKAAKRRRSAITVGKPGQKR
ncbi:MAG: IS66 family transposase [Chloroflexi bacterium]|nr:IS66 family transposase [Chloroflexota bacterium]